MSLIIGLFLLVGFVIIGLWIVSLIPPFGPPILKTLLSVFILLIALVWLFNMAQGLPGVPSLK